MKVKTSELTGLALDWAVTKCETPPEGYKRWFQDRLDAGENSGHPYSTEWDWGGPIITFLNNLFRYNRVGNEEPDVWCAVKHVKGEHGTALMSCDGPTALIATCRTYVLCHLGHEVEIPAELLK